MCGPDGCGGQCGFCPAGDVCNFMGDCVCMPDCEGKECGPDGCGGSCGSCPPGGFCSPGGVCDEQFCPPGEIPDCNDKCAPAEWVGDGFCDMEGSEFGANFNCAEFGWDAGDCEEDNCGNGYCQEYMGEDCENCPQDCGPCSGECDEPGFVPDCDGKCRPEWLLGNGQCNDGTGGGPGGGANFNCPQWEWDYGDCEPEPVNCGDGWCDWEMGEDCESCPWDCGPCGDGDCCVPHDGPGCEDPEIVECVCEFDSFCCEEYWDDVCVNEAIEYCGLWWCEPDWCDQICQEFECGEVEDCWCGDCPWGEQCIDNQCWGGPDCEEICWDKECGEWDGCNCGWCPPDSVCEDGICLDVGQGMSCQELVECAFDCGFGATCIFDCYTDGSEAGKAQFQALSLCVIQACGAPDVDCFMEAVSGPCEEEFADCH